MATSTTLLPSSGHTAIQLRENIQLRESKKACTCSLEKFKLLQLSARPLCSGNALGCCSSGIVRPVFVDVTQPR